MALHALIFKFLVFSGDLKSRGCAVVERQPLGKIIRAVTLGAGLLLSLFAKLLLMHGNMAVDAEILLGVGELEILFAIAHMAVFTRLHFMLARQRETSLIVKGPVRRHLRLHRRQLPAFSRMTLRAGDTFEFFMKGRVVR